jgi:hypothetical protein
MDQMLDSCSHVWTSTNGRTNKEQIAINRLNRPGCSVDGSVLGSSLTVCGERLRQTLSLGLSVFCAPASHTMTTGFLSPINDFDDTHSIVSSPNGSFIDFSQSASRFLLNTRSSHTRSGTIGSEDSATSIYAQPRSTIRINTNMMVRIYLSNSLFQLLLIAPLFSPHASPHATDLCLQHQSLTGPAPHT